MRRATSLKFTTIMAAILSELLYCQTPISDYSSGYNLLDLPEQRGIVMASYKDKAYLIGNGVYANGLKFESYDVNDYKVNNEAIDYKSINELRNMETAFLKKD